MLTEQKQDKQTQFDYRAAERAEGAWGKALTREARINFNSRRGQLINGVGSTCVKEFVYTNRETITDYSSEAFTH